MANDVGDVGTKFDADSNKELQKQTSELKKQNMKAVFGTGAGKLAVLAVVGAMITLFVVGSYIIFNKKPQANSGVQNANNAMLAAPQSGDLAVTSDEEAKRRREKIEQDAKEAQGKGAGFIAPPVLRSEKDNQEPNIPGSAQAQKNANAMNGGRAGTEMPPLPPPPDPAMIAQRQAQVSESRKYVEDLKKDQIMPQVVVAMGRNSVSTFSTGYYQLPDRTQKQAVQNVVAQNGVVASAQQGVAQNTKKGELIISAGEGHYCELDYKINTDAPRNDVFASCYSGKLAGARLLGKYEPPKDGATDPTVTVTLSLLTRPGVPSVPISAVAIDDSTESFGMADDVDSHAVRKYSGMFISSILKGLGTAASIITGTTTQVTVGATTTSTTSTDPITPARQAKISLGEVGNTFGDNIKKTSDAIKPTVRVNAKKGVRVVFLSDVFEEKK